MTYEEFLKTPFAIEFREKNSQGLKDTLKDIASDWPVSENDEALDSITNTDIDIQLREFYRSGGWENK